MDDAGVKRTKREDRAGEKSGNWDILSLALAVFGLWFLEMRIVGWRRG